MRNLFAFFALSVFLSPVLVSCDKEVAAVSDGDAAAEIVFGTELESKVTATTTLSGVNVLCVTGIAGSLEDEAWTVSGLSVSSGKVNTGKYWPATNLGYMFYGSNVAMTSTSDGPVVSVNGTKDVVCAANIAPTYNGANSLAFKHIYSRLGTVSVSNSDPASTSISWVLIRILDTYNGGDYNLYTGRNSADGTGWSSLSGKHNYEIATALGNNANDLYLVPGTYEIIASYVVIKSGTDYSYTATKKAKVTLPAGVVTALNCVLPVLPAEEVTLTVSVEPWQTETSSHTAYDME